jgi:hypothetical protein
MNCAYKTDVKHSFNTQIPTKNLPGLIGQIDHI